MATLYQLQEEALQLLEMMESEDFDSETLADTMESVVGEIEDKMESYAIVIKELEAEQKKFEEEAKRMKEQADRISRNIKNMKFVCFSTMQTLGLRKVDTEHFKWSIAKNGGKLPLICDDDPTHIPSMFHKTTVTVDKDKIRAALDNGEKLDFACYGERGESVRLK